MSSHSFRHFHSNRLPDLHLTPLGCLFPHRSPRQSSANAACGRFRTSPRRAAPKGHNLHLPRSTTSRSPTYFKLLSTFVAHPHHYYEPVRQQAPHRYSTSPVSAVRRAPSHPPTPPGADGPYRRPPSHVPCRSRRPGSRRLHAGHHLANQRAPARLIPETLVLSGFDAISFRFDTSSADRLRSPSWSPPDASRTPFPHRSPRRPGGAGG